MTFPIVALASSAGGLEALFELIPELERPNGAAFVVIQHLDRRHKSLLGELLAKKTAMPVVEIQDGLELQPEHIYVIPPNASVSLGSNRFRLESRNPANIPHHPADHFFASLAEANGGAAMGVVLSGGDSDGARGVEAIKHAGGITFAQEPGSARFPSMPQSAIDTGCVDYVLRPPEIAREIGRLARHPYLLATNPALDSHEADAAPLQGDEALLKQLFRLLRAAHGVEFAHYKRSTLKRRLARRMALRRIDELRDYIAVLQEDPAETAALYQDFLIRVTAFFRDPESFEELRTRIFPTICAERSPREPIRIWVPGCATGEEVYSIAICLAEYLGPQLNATRIQIFGTDVSEAAIEKARAGVFLENIAQEVSTERLARFFGKDNGHYHVAKSVRELCIFARHDVTRDPPFARLDLVSCRNLLIYLDAPAQRRIMQMFHYSLRAHAFLLLGPAESVGSAADLFDLVDKTHRIYARKPAAGRAGLDTAQRAASNNVPRGVNAGEEVIVFSEVDSVQRETDRFLLARYAPASLLVDEALNILQFRGETGPYVEHASGVASLNLRLVARPELLVELSPAIQEARDSGLASVRSGLSVGSLDEVTVEVVPFMAAANERYYLILLEESRERPIRRAAHSAANELPESEKDRRLGQLEREIVATRDYLQSAIEKHESVKEELKSAHEEVLSANEEFQSTNEELETAKEELQSTNEELTTTNDELRNRNSELSALNAELHKAREVSQRAERYAEAIVESVREPLAVLDPELRILSSNRAFFKDLKTRREDTQNRLLRELGSGQWNDPELLGRLEAVLTRNSPLDNYELAHTSVPGARPRTLLLNARKIPGDAEREQLILLAVEDVTERYADASHLRHADRQKDEFLAMLAHELRNPLAPITHAIHILKKGDVPVETADLYNMIERQTKRLARLVEQLLDVARINRGNIELRRETLDLSVLSQHAADAVRVRLEEFQQELLVVLPKAPVWVDGDPVRLEQIIANLLENAAKYTPRGGQIRLKLTQDRNAALLSVRDNGIGIAPENLDTIFDLFNQVDSSLARAGGGLGIGLTLVRRLLAYHGGRIEARSLGLGHGAEFVVQLPLAPEKVLLSEATTASNSGSMLEGELGQRVLVIDDNTDAAETMGLLARHWGHEVALAHDGTSALELAQSFQPDYALVDIGLPGMDGYELGRRLRDQHPGVHLVALTGYGRSEDRQAALKSGFNSHLTKPADLEALQRLLSTRHGMGARD